MLWSKSLYFYFGWQNMGIQKTAVWLGGTFLFQKWFQFACKFMKRWRNVCREFLLTTTENLVCLIFFNLAFFHVFNSSHLLSSTKRGQSLQYELKHFYGKINDWSISFEKMLEPLQLSLPWQLTHTIVYVTRIWTRCVLVSLYTA